MFPFILCHCSGVCSTLDFWIFSTSGFSSGENMYSFENMSFDFNVVQFPNENYVQCSMDFFPKIKNVPARKRRNELDIKNLVIIEMKWNFLRKLSMDIFVYHSTIWTFQIAWKTSEKVSVNLNVVAKTRRSPKRLYQRGFQSRSLGGDPTTNWFSP